uniref:Water stress and hypersensitive response domain-containing protein n=1 Tax=Gossypium raimondii TaxID=29730 RepID=A0A0D2S9Q5_GOSRA|nr:hypothetical protein B456_007G103700 [Gossypium raimondii]
MSQLLEKAKDFVVDKVANIKKPEASVSDVDLKHVSRECVEYGAKVSVSNPYSHSIPICEISYNFKSAGRGIASGTIPDPGSLKAGDTTMLDVPVKDKEDINTMLRACLPTNKSRLIQPFSLTLKLRHIH